MPHFSALVVGDTDLDRILDPYSYELTVAPWVDDTGDTVTYNPNARWSQWAPTHEWSHHLRVFPQADATDYISGPFPHGSIQARKRAVDFQGMLDSAARIADRLWEQMEMLTRGIDHPVWDISNIDLDQLNAHIQHPWVTALEDLDLNVFADPYKVFRPQLPHARELFIQRERNKVWGKYSAIVTEGRWLSMGDMGMFGNVNDVEFAAWSDVVGAVIDDIDADQYLTVIDCFVD